MYDKDYHSDFVSLQDTVKDTDMDLSNWKDKEVF